MKKAQITLFFVFFITAVTVIIVGAVLAPFGVMFNTEMYHAGETILSNAQESINKIDDATVRASLTNITDSALSATETNIEINSDLFKYSWIIVLVCVGLVIFMYQRRLVEYGAGGAI